MPRKQKLIGLLADTNTGYGRQLVRGVMQYANDHQQWRLLFDLKMQTQDPMAWEKCDGIIIAHGRTIQASFTSVIRHVVCCSGNADPELSNVVCMDDHAIGQLAAEHLMDCGLRQYAFWGRMQMTVDQNRYQGFKDALTQRGLVCHVAPPIPMHFYDVHWKPQPYSTELGKWLRELPKPIGILAVDDFVAQELSTACLEHGLNVPDQVAILGVGDDDLVCLTNRPALSSVETDGVQVGRKAAIILHKMLTRTKLTADDRHVKLPPIGVACRASSDLLAVPDRDIALALRYIRDHACKPCQVSDILTRVPLSRRNLQLQFQKLLGKSPQQVINSVRIQNAKRLLIDPMQSVMQVSRVCGFGTVQGFTRTFTKAVGQSPAAYRHNRIFNSRH